jgi:large subunit ribosomal protein L28
MLISLIELCYYYYRNFAMLLAKIFSGDIDLKCDLCGKTPLFGHNVSHSKRHTNRRFSPNIHPVTVYIEGRAKKLNLCTRCLRTQTKAQSA